MRLKAILGGLTLLALLFPSASLADTTPGLSVIPTRYTFSDGKLPSNGVNRPVFQFALKNNTSSALPITKLGIKYSGTATVNSVRFTRFDNNGNVVVIGQANFDPTKTAIITGSPLLNVPVNRTRDIFAEVTMGPSALGTTAKFFIDSSVIDYQTPTPPSLIDFPVPPNESVEYTVVSSSSVPQFDNILTPTPAEVITKGTKYKITWNANYGKDAFISKLELLKGNNLHTTLLSPTSKLTLTSFVWNVPSNIQNGNNYKVRITLSKGNPLSPTVITTDTTSNFSIQP